MTVPEPGWYLDPADSARLRWWDGAIWTDHVRPQPQPLPRIDSVPPIEPAVESNTETAQVEVPSAAFETTEEPREYVPMQNTWRRETPQNTAWIPRKEHDRQIRRNNTFAYLGLVFGLVAFLFNPLALLSILGIVFSSIGLAKSHDLDGFVNVTGRGTAIAGIIVGLLGLAAFTWLVSRALMY